MNFNLMVTSAALLCNMCHSMIISGFFQVSDTFERIETERKGSTGTEDDPFLMMTIDEKAFLCSAILHAKLFLPASSEESAVQSYNRSSDGSRSNHCSINVEDTLKYKTNTFRVNENSICTFALHCLLSEHVELYAAFRIENEFSFVFGKTPNTAHGTLLGLAEPSLRKDTSLSTTLEKHFLEHVNDMSTNEGSLCTLSPRLHYRICGLVFDDLEKTRTMQTHYIIVNDCQCRSRSLTVEAETGSRTVPVLSCKSYNGKKVQTRYVVLDPVDCYSIIVAKSESEPTDDSDVMRLKLIARYRRIPALLKKNAVLDYYTNTS